MKVAVAVGGAVVPAWQRDAIAALRSTEGLTTRVVRVGAAPWQPPKAIDARMGGPALRPALVQVDESELGAPDLVLDLTGTLSESSAPHGVWSFVLGASNDATLPFAPEVAAGSDTIEIALVRRANGRRERLRSGRFAVTAWYPSTLRLALSEAARWPATLVAALRDGASLEASGEAEGAGRRRAIPFQRVRFGWTLVKRLIATLAAAAFEVVEWNVGIVEGGVRALLSGEPLHVRWLPQPAPRTFIADPFMVERDGKRVIFVEQYAYDRDRGVIEALVLDQNDAIAQRARVLELPTHISYPYPLEIDGAFYLVPESGAAGEAAFYRCASFPDAFERERALLQFDAVDTTVFEHDGRWWAMCTRWTHGANISLHVFYADSPAGPWAPHALNPVVVDVGRARPGGQPFTLDGVLYRPGQDCASRYGGALVIARIDELTPQSYRETVVRRIDGSGLGRYSDGVHTLSVCGEAAVIDGQHVYRHPAKLRWAIRRIPNKLRRMFGRRPAPKPSLA